MTILDFSLLSVGVSSLLISLVLLLLLISSVVIMRRVTRILTQIEKMAFHGAATSQTIELFVGNMSEQILHVLELTTTIKGIRSLFKQTKTNKRKETSHVHE